jgi:hypothetical protein
MPGRLTVNIDFPELASPIKPYRPNGPFMALTKCIVYETFQSRAFEKNAFFRSETKQWNRKATGILRPTNTFQTELLSRENCIHGQVSHETVAEWGLQAESDRSEKVLIQTIHEPEGEGGLVSYISIN